MMIRTSRNSGLPPFEEQEALRIYTPDPDPDIWQKCNQQVVVNFAKMP